MIERTQSFKVGDKSFLTLVEAQKYEIEQLLKTDGGPHDFADWMLDNKNKIVDILTMTPNSKPKARRINGGRKNRTVITDAAVNVTSITNVPTPSPVAKTYVAHGQ